MPRFRLSPGRLVLLGFLFVVFFLFRYIPSPVHVDNDDDHIRHQQVTLQHVDYQNERPNQDDNSLYGEEGDWGVNAKSELEDPNDTFLKSNPRSSPSKQKFFGMWFSPGKTALPDKMRLSLGSFFYHHPNSTFTMYSNDLVPKTFEYFTSRGFKVEVKKFDIVETFKECAPNKSFVTWAMEGDYLRPGAVNRNVHITDALRLCFSYIHGGVYMDMDIFILKPIDYTDRLAYLNGVGGNCPIPPYELECSPPYQPQIEFHGQQIWLPSEVYLSTGFYALSPHSEFARMGLEHMMVYDNPNCWNCIGPRTFSHVYKYMKPASKKPLLIPSCDDVRIPFYENDPTMSMADRRKEVKHCPYAHLYASAEKLNVKKGSLFWELMRDMCIGCDVFL